MDDSGRIGLVSQILRCHRTEVNESWHRGSALWRKDAMALTDETDHDVVQINGVRLPILGTGRIYVCGITPTTPRTWVMPPHSSGPIWPLGSCV